MYFFSKSACSKLHHVAPLTASTTNWQGAVVLLTSKPKMCSVLVTRTGHQTPAPTAASTRFDIGEGSFGTGSFAASNRRQLCSRCFASNYLLVYTQCRVWTCLNCLHLFSSFQLSRSLKHLSLGGAKWLSVVAQLENC